jgi:endoglucanase
MYATALGYFMTVYPELGQKMYQDKIVDLYSNDKSTFREDLPYYEQNWLWFSSALFNQELVPS